MAIIVSLNNVPVPTAVSSPKRSLLVDSRLLGGQVDISICVADKGLQNSSTLGLHSWA